MSEIDTIGDLSSFADRIESVRSRLRQSTTKSDGFLFGGQMERDTQSIVEENQRAYESRLPRQITLSPEMGKLLASLYTDYARSMKDVWGDHDGVAMGGRMMRKAVSFLVSPSPVTLAMLGYDIVKGNMDIERMQNASAETARRMNKHQRTILGSYKLTKKGEDYVLERGDWFMFRYSRFAQSSGRFFTAVENVGVDSSLLPDDLNRFISKNTRPESSLTVGRWPDEYLRGL